MWCSQTSNYDIDALYSSCTCTNITSDARTSAQLHFDISNLSAGTQYWVAVRARSDSSNPAIYSPTVPSGVGPWTALNAITVIGQPDTPPFITTSANGSQGIRMNWVRPADTGLGGVAQPLLMYQIELSEISCCKMVRMLSAADYYTTLFLENLEVGTQVYARIRTVNVVGKSLFSAYSDAATVVLLPSPPLDVTVALAPLTTYQQNLFYTDGRMPRSAQIEISFGRPYDTGLRSINDTTWRLLKYKITASLNSSGIAGQGGNCSGAHGNSIIQLEMLDISAPIHMEGLNIGCSWIFRVTAFNEAGEGGVGGGISKMMVIPAFAPRNLHVRAVADETIRVEWERPSNTGTGDSLNPILWWHLDLTMNVSGLAVLYQACNDSSYVASTESDEWNFNVVREKDRESVCVKEIEQEKEIWRNRKSVCTQQGADTHVRTHIQTDTRTQKPATDTLRLSYSPKYIHAYRDNICAHKLTYSHNTRIFTSHTSHTRTRPWIHIYADTTQLDGARAAKSDAISNCV